MNRRLVLILRRRLPILIVIPLLGAIAAALIAPGGAAANPPDYTAVALVAADQAAASQTEVQQALVQAVEGPAAATVARSLGLTADEVTARIDATFDEESYVVSIAASGDTPGSAEELARAFGQSFVDLGNFGASEAQQAVVAQAEADRDAARADLDAFLTANEGALAETEPPPALLTERTALENALASAEGDVAEIRAGLRPTSRYEMISVSDGTPTSTSKLDLLARPGPRILLGAGLGLLAAIAVVVLAEKANPRIDDPAQAEALVGAPILALVPLLGRRRRPLLKRVDPATFRGPLAEAFRTLRTTIDFRAGAGGGALPVRLMITSATPGEGKSTTAAFLAAAYAATGAPPVVIGSDLRRPAVHRMFEVERSPGLSTRAVTGTSPALHEMLCTDRVTGISVMPSGPGLDEVTSVVDDVAEVAIAGHDMGRTVILDTAPVRVANDAIDLLPAVDCVIVVVRTGRSTVRSVAQMMQTLRINDAAVLGVVVLGSVESSDSLRYYASYYAAEAAPRRRWRRSRPIVDVRDPAPGDDREPVLTR